MALIVQNIKRSYDVIVVGAGPSGSTLGYLLSDKGLNVLVIDKESFPRQKLCAGGLTWKTRRLLEKIYEVSFDRQFPIESSSGHYQVYEMFKEKISQESAEPFHFVDRRKYDMELVSLAQKKNCKFLFGCHVTNLDVQDNVVFTQSGDSLQGRVIIGADGANSKIRKNTQPQKTFNRNSAFAFQISVPLSKINPQFQDSVPRVFFGQAKWGYAWIYPHKDYFVVGIWGSKRKDKNLKEKYLKFLNGVTEFNVEREAIKNSHIVPIRSIVRPPGKNRTLLLGDAAGLVDPFTGEGIYYAHKSAELASKAVIDFFNSDGGVDPLQSYEESLGPVYRELTISKRFGDLAYSYLRTIGYIAIKSPGAYLKVTRLIHGIDHYSQLPLISGLRRSAPKQ